MRWPRLVLALCVVSLAGCGDDGRTEIWIYTSIYPSVIERMEPALQEEFPDVSFQWFQKGSEQVAARLNAEFAAGETSCDLLMTSDPFYYLELKESGRLVQREGTAESVVPETLRDPDHAFATVRIPLMVIAVNHDRVPEADRPKSFADLTKPAFRGRVSMGDPLKSGTNFTTVTALSKKYGWEYFEKLRRNDMISAGGNSAVIGRLETGERPVGIVLLENVLPRIAVGSPMTVIYPEDGAIPIPSPVAVLKDSAHPDLALRIRDFMFREVMQDAIVEGHMYAPAPGHAPPAGARPWEEIELYPWDNAFLRWTRDHRDDIKRRFREIMRG